MYTWSTYTILLGSRVTIRLDDRMEHYRTISKAQFPQHHQSYLMSNNAFPSSPLTESPHVMVRSDRHACLVTAPE